MKTLKITFVMLMTALFLVLPSCSKDDVNVTLTPSEEVVNAFQQKYPDVKNVKWEILVGAYEAEFIYSGTYSENGQHIVLDKVEAQAYITQGGKWIRSEFDVTKYYQDSFSLVVPRAVRETIAAKGKKVDDVKLFDWSDRNDYFYVEFDESDSELLINFNGTLY
ncbi:hypothetical protein [Phocaeicola coprocola]